MNSINVFISAEDQVTESVIRRLLNYVSPRFAVFQNIPARGGEVKSKVPQCNNLAQTYPVIMLLDVDDGCAPSLKDKLFQKIEKNDNFVFNVSVDEAEAWLMADREGFSEYFGIPMDEMPDAKPQKQNGRNARIEMEFPIKSSFYLTHVLAPKSTKDTIRKQVAVLDPKGPTKGKEYNLAVTPFIDTAWNIERAMSNSDSLQRMVGRLQTLLNKF